MFIPSYRGAALAVSASLGLVHAGSFAADSIQLYGLADVNVGSYQASGAERDTRVESGGMTTSYFGIKGEEDLGNGLAATIQLESFVRVDSGDVGRFPNDAFWSRNANVGLRGNFGAVKLGRATTPLFVSTLLFNPLGDSFGFSPSIRSFFGATGKVAGDTGWSNAITWSAPKFGGVGATLQYALGEGSVSGDSIGANLVYFSGPIGATLAVQQVKATFASGDETTWQLGGSYSIGIIKAFAQIGRVDEGATTVATAATGTTPAGTAPTATANTKDTITQLGASMPLGAGSLLASYARGKTSGARSDKRDFFALGYDYTLSKRTDAYLMTLFDKRDQQSRGTSLAVGVRHRF